MRIENTATAAMLIPVALTLSRQVQEPTAARAFLVLLVLGIAYSASIGGMGTVMGAASNAVAAGFLANIQPWRFMDWMRYGLPALLLLLPLTWWLLLRMLPPSIARLDVAPAREALAKQGGVTSQEWELLATLLVAIFFWVSGELLEGYFELPPTLLSAALVGVAAVAYLGIRGILQWEDMKGVSWGIFLIIGAGLSLGDALIRTGVTDWFATLLGPSVTGLPLVVSLMLLVLASALLTNLINNTTITALFVPVVISIAAADPAYNAVQLVLPVALATTFGYSLPSAPHGADRRERHRDARRDDPLRLSNDDLELARARSLLLCSRAGGLDMNEHSMTILVVGAGRNGARVLRQLRKNPRLKILTLDPRENPHAITEGLLDKVDFTEALTPLTLDIVLKQARPDLVLLTMSPGDMGLGESAGIGMLADALRDELAMLADVPVIEVARSAAH